MLQKMTCVLLLAAFSCVQGSVLADSDAPEPSIKDPQRLVNRVVLAQMIPDLSSTDDKRRLVATKAILDMGKDALEPLRDAGAKQVTPHKNESLRRIDMIYSLIDGLKMNGKSRPDLLSIVDMHKFGIELQEGVTQEDVERMGRQYGFRVTSDISQAPRRAVRARLDHNKTFGAVLRELLSNEAGVNTVTLTYRELYICGGQKPIVPNNPDGPEAKPAPAPLPKAP